MDKAVFTPAQAAFLFGQRLSPQLHFQHEISAAVCSSSIVATPRFYARHVLTFYGEPAHNLPHTRRLAEWAYLILGYPVSEL